MSSERDHRQAVGGMWDEIGRLQFDFMLAQGLLPHHRLVDVGCGSLRGGVHFVRYLDPGNYYGIDRDADLIAAGTEIELPAYGVSDRSPNFLVRDDFDMTGFKARFDYGIAQSVFTHIPWNTILRCLVNVARVLAPGGRFYATFFEDPDGSARITSITHSPGGIVTYPDRDPYHYEFSVFEDLAARAGLTVERLGSWDHPRNQLMMVFGPDAG